MAKLLTPQQHVKVRELVKYKPRKPRRALALGGGGPAVGISIGFLLALQEWNERMAQQNTPQHAIEFPIWVAGCVGGWLACLYHVCDQPRASKVEELIRGFFRETDMYQNFPAPKTFTPDLPEQITAGLKFLIDPISYKDLVVPEQISKAYFDILNYYLRPSQWSAGDFAYLMLNSMFAPNPASRLLMSILYKSEVKGLNKIWFGPEYHLLDQFDLTKLQAPGQPHIYINSYNINRHKSEVYSNYPKDGRIPAKPITMPVLCASSALPYILTPIELDGETHIEGALIDSFCLEAIHSHHEDINEVWISQIVDHQQVRAPKHLLDALNNLIMLYAGTTSRHDIEVFANDVNRHDFMASLVDPKHVPNPIEILRLPIESSTNYEWSYENLDNSIARSKANCLNFIEKYTAQSLLNGWRQPRHENIFVRSSQFT